MRIKLRDLKVGDRFWMPVSVICYIDDILEYEVIESPASDPPEPRTAIMPIKVRVVGTTQPEYLSPFVEGFTEKQEAFQESLKILDEGSHAAREKFLNEVQKYRIMRARINRVKERLLRG